MKNILLILLLLFSNNVFARQVLDDSRSVVLNSNSKFNFEDIADTKNNYLTTEFAVNLHLDTSDYRGRNCRIFIKLSEFSNYEGLIVRWFGNGMLINSEFSGNNRSLVYSGLINGNEIVDYLNFKLLKDNNYRIENIERFKFVFEIEC